MTSQTIKFFEKQQPIQGWGGEKDYNTVFIRRWPCEDRETQENAWNHLNHQTQKK